MYLYLLNNPLINKYYIGVTNDLDRRLIEHNTNNGHYTGNVKGVWIVVGHKILDRENAYSEEIRLKKAKNKKYIFWYFSNKGR